MDPQSDETMRSLEQSVKELTTVLEEVGSIMGHRAKVDDKELKLRTKNDREAGKSVKDFIKYIREGTEEFKDNAKWWRNNSEEINKLASNVRNARAALDEMAEKAEKGQVPVKDVERAQRAYDVLAKSFEKAAAFEDIRKTLASTLASVGSNVASTSKDLINSVQSNSGAFDIGASVMKAGVNTGVTALAGTASAVGTAMATLIPPIGPVGVGLKALGAGLVAAAPFIEKFGNKVSDVASFAIDVLKKEVEKTIQSYDTMNRSGAIFAGGMTEMREVAGKTGLTIEQLSNVTGKVSSKLAMHADGVAGGIRLMGATTKRMKESGADKALMRLGYGFEEQAELQAEVFERMQRYSKTPISDKELASATADYAKNLRLLSSITGEDARAKAEQVKAENMTAAFQLRISEMTETQRNELELGMGAFPKATRQMLREIYMYGDVVTQQSALVKTMFPAQYEAALAGAKMAKEGTATAKSLGDLAVRASSASLAQGKAAKSLFDANFIIGDYADVAAAGTEIIDQSAKLLNKDIEKTSKDIAAAAKPKPGSDKLGDSLVDARVAAQDLAVQFQDKILKPNVLGLFAQGIKEVNESLFAFIDKLTGDSKPKKEPTGAKRDDYGRYDYQRQEDEALGRDPREQGSFWRKLGSVFSGGKWEDPNASKPEIKEVPVPSRKNGGLVNMPDSGGLAMLHGAEAVVPLPDGNTIPVSLDLASLRDFTRSRGVTSSYSDDAVSSLANEILSQSKNFAISIKEFKVNQDIGPSEIQRTISDQMSMMVTGMSLDTASMVRSITANANVTDPKLSDASKIIKSDLDEMRRQFALDMNTKRRDQGNLEPRLVTPDELANITRGLMSTVASEEPKKDMPLAASGFDFSAIADIATKAVPMLGGISSLIGNTVDLFRKPEKTETPKEEKPATEVKVPDPTPAFVELTRRVEELTAVTRQNMETTAKVVERLETANRISSDILTATR